MAAPVSEQQHASWLRLAIGFAGVTAGVVALGWLLVNVAAFGPVPTSADPVAQGPILLEPAFALISGEAGFNPSRRDAGPHITHWKRPDDVVRWRFYVPVTGQYRVNVHYSCDAKNAGGTLAATVAARDYELKVDDTGGFDKPLAAALGNVSFPETGWHILALRGKDIRGEELMHLHGITFTLAN